MVLSKGIRPLERVTSQISRAINSVGAGVLFAMMFLTAMDVLLRYIFNRPIKGGLELTVYMMVIVVAFGLAYCQILKGHVRVDLVISRFSPRAQAGIDGITYLVSLGLMAIITRQSILYVGQMFEKGITSAVLLIPIFPFVILLVLGCAVFSLALLVDFLDKISKVAKK